MIFRPRRKGYISHDIFVARRQLTQNAEAMNPERRCTPFSRLGEAGAEGQFLEGASDRSCYTLQKLAVGTRDRVVDRADLLLRLG